MGRNGYEIPGHKVTPTVHTMEGTKKSFRMVVIRKEKRQAGKAGSILKVYGRRVALFR